MFTFENPRMYYKYTNNIVMMFKKNGFFIFSLSLTYNFYSPYLSPHKKNDLENSEVAFFICITEIVLKSGFSRLVKPAKAEFTWRK